MSWRDNHSEHAEFRSRAFGRANPIVYPNCRCDSTSFLFVCRFDATNGHQFAKTGSGQT
jgi:hypothetical protein